ncbi:MAG: hypothetical protein ACTSYT_02995 [Candidatus Asgardarchaeia archaeon]
MSGQIDTVVNGLFSKDSNIGALAIIGLDGTVKGLFGQWSIDGSAFMNAINNKEPSITVQGVKYSILTSTEHSFIATNIKGMGYLVGASIPDKAWVVVYLGPDGDPKLAQKELFEILGKLSKLL